ncbi:MAG: DUF3047 domain-containing protein [Gammaproteobacteria bacterium]
MSRNFIFPSLFFLMLSGFSGGAGAADDRLMVGAFSSGTLSHWESKAFKGETCYRLIDLAGEKVLKAESNGTASGLVKKQRIDLDMTPYLNWRWRIDERLGALNEQAKSGDDYAARVYVVVSGGWAFWRTRAINYVWAQTSPKGKIWPNAFAGDHAVMIALRSSGDAAHTWFHEKRNVRDDLKRQFGEDIRYLDAVAIMTDTDNAGGRALSYYGDIFFSSK